MGVWIETLYVVYTLLYIRVTPFVGVWIETLIVICTTRPPIVTPFVGVWIETWAVPKYRTGKYRHTLRGCVD